VTSYHERDALRARWQHFRQEATVDSVHNEAFGSRGLARHSPEIRTRFIILPSDPEASIIDFDSEAWDWWATDVANPFDGGPPTRWGFQRRAISEAAVLCDYLRDNFWNWDKYLALHRSGALEFGLGHSGSRSFRRREGNATRRAFFLVVTIGRMWWALARYTDVIERVGPSGPWQCILAFKDTASSVLANLAAGWADPMNAWSDEPPSCPDPNVLITRDLEEWPDEAARRQLAFELGARVEDSWGCSQRRFLTNVQGQIPHFDASVYG
jgi:hypothetical protein